MDANDISVRTFDRIAQRYDQGAARVTLYDDSHRLFCEMLPSGPASVLDAACGPGNITRFLLAQRPELDVLGIDLAPAMVELARAHNPGAAFVVHDCRNLAALGRRFDGIVCGFGLPYLSMEEGERFIAEAGEILGPAGVLYFGVMEDTGEGAAMETYATGDRVYLHYHSEAALRDALGRSGFRVLDVRRKRSPNAGGKMVTDLLMIAGRDTSPARRGSAAS